MTDVLRVNPGRPDSRLLARAAACLRTGGLVAFPTETVYGLGAHALDAEAVRRLFEAKQRPTSDPLIVHVATADAIGPLVAAQPPLLATLAEHFWPGPLTLILPRAPVVSRSVTAGLDTVAVRVPAHPIAQALLRAATIPVAAPSANLFSHPSPTMAAHVLDDLDGRIDMIVDGGPTTVGLESTVVDLSTPAPLVLRQGAISLARLREVLPEIAVGAGAPVAGAGMASPGLLPRHYAPKAPLTLYAGEPPRCLARIREDAEAAAARGERVGVLAAAGDVGQLGVLPALIVTFGPDGDLEAIATRLYAALRELDRVPLDRILARDVTRHRGSGTRDPRQAPARRRGPRDRVLRTSRRPAHRRPPLRVSCLRRQGDHGTVAAYAFLDAVGAEVSVVHGPPRPTQHRHLATRLPLGNGREVAARPLVEHRV